MKYTIEGFSQQRLINFGLDVVDAMILRWIVDFYHTDSVKKYIFGDNQFMWIHYSSLLEDMPILGLKKRALYNRLTKMVSAGVLYHHCEKGTQGSFSYYGISPAHYSELISKEGCASDVGGSAPKCRPGMYQNADRVCTKMQTKDPSTKEDPSTKKQRKAFSPPTLEEFKAYCEKKGYGSIAEKAFEYYASAEWHDSNGNKVRNWKQKLIAVWFREENRDKQEDQDEIDYAYHRPFED